MSWFAQAPSNIALIKYMGKRNEDHNLPDNPSLSYTLNNLLSTVTLESYTGSHDLWEPLDIPGGLSFTLSVHSQQRFLNHLAFLKQHFNYSGCFIVRSCNNFPLGSGLASSASSFAALTRVAALALSELTQIPIPDVAVLAALSREGSGSSCRCFFSPWALWDNDSVHAVNLAQTQLLHQAILISHEEKIVSSSMAHQRVKTSPLYKQRPWRATQNLKTLLNAFETNDWYSAYTVCWREFQDMHALFSTCDTPFHYITSETQTLLKTLQLFWEKQGDGPLVTMDAGPNVHLLYRADQNLLAKQFHHDHLLGQYDVL